MSGKKVVKLKLVSTDPFSVIPKLWCFLQCNFSQKVVKPTNPSAYFHHFKIGPYTHQKAGFKSRLM